MLNGSRNTIPDNENADNSSHDNNNEDDWEDEQDDDYLEEEEDDEDYEVEEDEEEEEAEMNDNDDMEEEKVVESKVPKTAWVKHIHKHDQVTGKFFIRDVLRNEHKDNRKKILSHRVAYEKKEKAFIKNGSNQLFFDSASHKAHSFQTFIPNEISYTFEGIGSRIYNGQFNFAGNKFLATSQTGTTMFDYNDDNEMSLNKTIKCHNVSWALTDSDFTQDNRYMIHSTLSPNIQLFDVEKKKYLAQLDVNDPNDDEDDDMHSYWNYGLRVYSAKISADGKEVIAGTSRTSSGYAKLQIFDVHQSRITRSINAHSNDVNSVCFVDKENSSLVITGSDDGLCKLWDTRASSSSEAVGIFYGHLSGMTNVCSKEDGRYFISNSKDQSIKLWDIRKTTAEKKRYRQVSYDYRMGVSASTLQGIKDLTKKNDQDDSVQTYWGHSISGTLIRCHFSPKFITDQRYIYCGSADSSVYIFDLLTGENVAKLQVNGSKIIRDCAWHPFSQNIVTTDFSGNICRWEFFDCDDQA